MAASAQRKRTKAFLTTVLFALIATANAQSMPDLLKPFEKIDYTKQTITVAQLEKVQKSAEMNGLDEDGGPEAAAFIRGIVFGKHGRIFRETGIQDYLKKRPWYHADPKFTNDVLTDQERKNLDVIREFESSRHASVRPGDMRFWMTKKVKTFTEDYGYNASDIGILKAEIEAIHGKTFPSEPLLQKYFNERYWYKADPAYKFAMLSATEKENLKALEKLEQKVKGTTFAPSDVISYSDKLIPEKLLTPLSLYDLRLTRNAFYALRGRSFKTPWLKEYFDSVEWYSPLPEGQTEKLEDTDFKNVDRIVRIEKQLHDELSTKAVPHERLTGLFVEDLRKLANEIPARHGQVFKDKAMKSYFTSMPWYKPNPGFKLSNLNKIEKKNYDFLLQAAKDTTTQFNMEEG